LIFSERYIDARDLQYISNPVQKYVKHAERFVATDDQYWRNPSIATDQVSVIGPADVESTKDIN